ncbi:unnamed protein product (macronuclear) [Paramecium tetraurelia]|uniref:EF-hand domain-containing protein n=1 Tax=Paramecium tetraurelia TaxID=5888 RepID=A0CNP3_PARTE|nr:uncharacterized protein GSPATT00008852001 [Paramecium tetraurelia]CAK72410.1 unnamed protein product [Paramecium tetraurelia]|eukprot:XP_001439807.1 hypothetical protein (macronuclear) [Paramecium tetraurelia strain d4-2]
MAYYGVGLPTAVQELVFRFRNHVCKANPYCTLSRLKAIFQQYDKNGNGKLNLEELDNLLKSVGMFLKVVELQALIKYFDKDGDGFLSFREFLTFIREEMNERRNAMVLKVYESQHNTKITSDFLRQIYKIDNLTDGMKTFIDNIRVGDELTYEQFMEFHEELSLNIASDETFTSILSKAWNIDEKQEDTAFQEYLQNSLQQIKERLIARAGGKKFIVNVFQEFDTNKSKDLSISEFIFLLKKLELDWNKAAINRVYRIMDQNNSGSIEEQEFISFFTN